MDGVFGLFFFSFFAVFCSYYLIVFFIRFISSSSLSALCFLEQVGQPGGDQPRADAQHQERDQIDRPAEAGLPDREEQLAAGNDVMHFGGDDAGDGQRNEGARPELEQQQLDGEDDGGNRRAENRRQTSRISPKVAILKPLSAAVSIGSGQPFGAEGPVIQTGAAIGSILGQALRSTTAERKVLLACGAAAGLAATRER